MKDDATDASSPKDVISSFDANNANRRLRKAIMADGAPGIRLLRRLVKQGGDLFQQVGVDRVEKTTLMHHAAVKGHDQVIHYLVREGMAVDVPDDRGQSPLWVAALQNSDRRLRSVHTLLALGASPDIINARSESLMQRIHWQGFGRNVRALLDAGADVSGGVAQQLERRCKDKHKQFLEDYVQRWQHAAAFARDPHPEDVTPRLVCALGNIGRLDVLGNLQLWQGREAQLQKLLMDVPPFLSEKILTLSPQLIKLLEPQTSVQGPASAQLLHAGVGERQR